MADTALEIQEDNQKLVESNNSSINEQSTQQSNHQTIELSDINNKQQNQQEDIQEENKNDNEQGKNEDQQPIIYRIEEHTQFGNLVPQIMAIQNGFVDKHELDATGYNILHHAVSYNKISGVIPLVKKLKIDINVLSATRQTPLMIACNYGFIKMGRVLINNGASINDTDMNSFNALLYCVKANMDKMALYLITQGANIHVKDINGCSLVHWAAYNNNVFLLSLFNRLGLPLNEKDKVGYSPFMRAIFNDGYETVEYLLQNVNSVIPQEIVLDNIKSVSIKLRIQKFISQNKDNFINRQKRKIKENSQSYTQLFLFFSAALIYYSFVTQCIYRLQQEGLTHYLNIIFNVLIFAYIPLIMYFSTKVQNASQNVGSLMRRQQENSRLDNDIDFQLLNKALNMDQNDQGFNKKVTFLHRLLETIHNQDWVKYENYSIDQFCPDCLIIKSERMAHCHDCGICVDKFEKHLKCFNKCLNRSNIGQYTIVLIVQQILLELYFYLFIVGYYNKLTTSIIFSGLEIPYIMVFKEKVGILPAITFLYSGILLFQNLIDLSIALYGMLYNMTHYEIFNRRKCWYYFEQEIDNKVTHNLHIDYKQRPTRYFVNKYFKGFCANISEYMSEN